MTGHIERLHQQYIDLALSPVDVISRHLDAAGTLGFELNAFASVLAEGALRDAEASRERYRQGAWLSPLDGVPMTIKDLFHMKGTVTGCGSLAYPSVLQTRDADMVRDLKQAGAIIIGKTNLLEFAFGLVHPDIGPAHNPWDPNLSIGGSSSGSAAAVAAGIGMASMGTDTAGSVRNPAAWGGVVGFKPSYGHFSSEGLIPLSPSLDHVGILTSSVADARSVFESLKGQRAEPDKDWRVAVVDLGFTHDDVKEVTDNLIQRLSLHVEMVDPVTFDWNLANAAAITMITAESYAVHRDLLQEQGARYGAPTRVRLLAGESITAHDYIRARQIREKLRREWALQTQDVDFVVLPTLPSVAVAESEALVEDLSSATLYTSTFALLGLPAVSIPAGLGAQGRPVGLQIVGRPGMDAEVLALAQVAEDLRGPFATPPYHANLF